MDAAEFVPGQWDKPKQGELPGTLDKSGSQQSLSFQTDDASALQGSDAAANEYAQADYSQQYYTAQVNGLPDVFWGLGIPHRLLPALMFLHDV